MTTLFIPSPPVSGFHLGPLQIHFYALCILVGMVVGIWLGNRRFVARGGTSDDLESVLIWAIPLGIVGARLYHVITDYELYVGPGRNPWNALKIWQGGLGIWGAVALGAVGALIGCRRRGIRFWALADALAPGILIAQAMGRVGNWFNQELFGRPTSLPWALEIAPQFRPAGFEQFATFHPTFLYELLWDLAMAGVLLSLDRRFRLGRGKLFWLYVALYCLGRMFVEHLRIDAVNHVGGFRLNEYTSVIMLVVALAVFAWLMMRRPGREDSVLATPTITTRDTADVRPPIPTGETDAAVVDLAEPRSGTAGERSVVDARGTGGATVARPGDRQD